jgi:membrane associated rhomboid family serine protease
MFFPYRARIALFQLPVLTILVCLMCIGIFVAQYTNQRALFRATGEFCEREDGGTFLRALKWIGGSSDSAVCVQLMMRLYHARDEKAELSALAQHFGNASMAAGGLSAHYEEALLDTYRTFRLNAPANLTTRLWYPPESWNPVRMVTAAFAHGGWVHLIGNLFFFFAFAATIEILLGPILYIGVLIVLALGTHSVYSLVMMQNAQALPTVGLSGVVMGMIALFVFFIPQARINCFLWLIWFYRRFAVPAWLLAAWFIGWDVYSQFAGGKAGVNVIAHLSGAAIGFLLGVTLFRQKRHWAQELIEEKD